MAHRDPLHVRRRRLIFALSAVLVLAFVAGFAWFFLVGPGRPGGPSFGVIVEMSGDGNKVGPRFFARRGWEIDWENTGPYFSYTIHGEVEFGQVITQNEPGNGITNPVPTGNFFIEVVAQGPWTIQVIQGE
jgi:hypothetical protein